jgi:hypothetical protein
MPRSRFGDPSLRPVPTVVTVFVQQNSRSDRKLARLRDLAEKLGARTGAPKVWCDEVAVEFVAPTAEAASEIALAARKMVADVLMSYESEEQSA